MSFEDRRIWKEVAGLKGEKIVLFDWTGQSPTFCNLIKVGADGEIAWMVATSHALEGVYSDVVFDGKVLTAYNIAGYRDVIEYETGKVIRREFVK